MYLKTIFSILLMIAAFEVNAAATKYDVQEISVDTIGGVFLGNSVNSINNKGHVAGSIRTSTGDIPFFWTEDDGGIAADVKMDSKSLHPFFVTGLNDDDKIVGIAITNEDTKGFIWDGKEDFQYLSVDENRSFKPCGINNNGMVVGYTSPKDMIIDDREDSTDDIDFSWWPKLDDKRQFYTLKNGKFQEIVIEGFDDLILLPRGINDNNQIIFETFKLTEHGQPYPWSFLVWDNGRIIASEATQVFTVAFNNNADVLLWDVPFEGGQIKDGGSIWNFETNTFKILEELEKFEINGMNDKRQLVGSYFNLGPDSTDYAFIYDEKKGVRNLNDQLDKASKKKNIVLESADAINNKGQIICDGTKGKRQTPACFLLTPKKK